MDSKRKSNSQITYLKITHFFGLLKILVLSLLILSCSNPKPNQQGIVYIPPTPAATSVTPTATLTPPNSETPSLTPPCIDNLQFLRDLSIPDGTMVTPKQLLDKRWEVQNTGTCNWDYRYQLKLIDGLDLGAGKLQALFPARSSTLAEIRIVFTAPQEIGVYRSAWQAFNPDGKSFGDPIFIEVVVDTSTDDG